MKIAYDMAVRINALSTASFQVNSLPPAEVMMIMIGKQIRKPSFGRKNPKKTIAPTMQSMAIATFFMGIAIGQLYDDSARPLAYALLGCSLASLGLVLFSERGKLFQRVLPPGSRRETVNPR